MEFPINPELMTSYRNNLLTGGSPSFIDTNVPITPTIDISPTGSIGVRNTLTTGSVTTINDTYTVPINEEWELLGVGIQNSGVMTITNCTFSLQGFAVGGTNTSFTLNIFSTITGPQQYTYLLPGKPIILKTGDIIRASTVISAWTSGAIQTTLLYNKRVVG
jgi:hypothetical protein